MNKLQLTFSIILLSYGLNSKAQDLTKYERVTFIKGKDSISYRVLFPENFDRTKKYPILFFLHGSGERGNDNQSQLTHGGGLFLKEEVRKQFPAIIVFPQCSSDSFWSNVEFKQDATGNREFLFQEAGQPSKAMQALLAMIDNFAKKPYVDKHQVYAAGLSMGGMGTYELLRRKPKLFAAAFTICGGDNVANVQKYKNTPMWIFHGEKDDVVPVLYSTSIADQLKVLGSPVKLTLYPNANHNSWDSAFAEPELLPWLFSKHK
ncbi:Alpha/beta hydrolase family protein [Pedobacter sp. ok626]|uniref:carboxylesterase family protein n=1 Tax=Pedobacter sp. ok626 TaxID=1761882 RepID=UPI00088C2771|nr:prolyl oligopeptidase family serine peptidase [Pedobacter sp. ok626]SDK75196.1 Alpha/beta hydrolase family protein [Pedobacter sp. ok626]